MEVTDKRVLNWGKQKIHTHGDADYKHKAIRGQDATANKASIVGGRITRAIHAEPRSNLPSTVHGFSDPHSVSRSSRTSPRVNTQAPPPTTIGGQRLGNSRSGGTPTGPTDFAQKAPSGLEDQPPSSTIKEASAIKEASTIKEAPALKGAATGIPPHLRIPNTAANKESTPPPYKSSRHGTRAVPSMSAGTAEKSAKLASKFPCTYNDCTLGFMRAKELKTHKQDSHYYCRLCDEDFGDFNDLLCHKLENEEHICCCVCGEDFRSEGGRDRHERQVSLLPHIVPSQG